MFSSTPMCLLLEISSTFQWELWENVFFGREGKSRLNAVSSENHCLSLRALPGQGGPDEEEEENSSMSRPSIQLVYVAS